MKNALLHSACLFLLMLVAAIPSVAATDSITPGDRWLDDRGQLIQAHGGGITHWKRLYYWFGEDRTQTNDPEKRYVTCYSSRDLVHWKFRHKVVALSDPEHLGPRWVLERPKVFFNPRTHKFVLYAH